jgi:hypothetical protein
MENEERRRFQAQKMEALGRLASGIAHDINNILGAIEGYATLVLKEMPTNDPARPDIEEIRKAEQRAAELTRQLLTFSRSTTGQKSSINLSEIVAEAAKKIKPQIGENIFIEISTAPDLKPAHADPGQLEQALGNLMLNARDAMPGGGQIKITAGNADLAGAAPKCPRPVEPGRQFVKISVGDRGTGMSADILNHLFEPFFTTKPKGKGKGLGLPIVYGIVNQHNGWIEV